MDPKVVAAATEATNIFTKLHSGAAVSSGFSQNHDNIVVIDCAVTGNRVGLITVDSQPNDVCLVVGPKGTDQVTEQTIVPIANLTSAIVLDYMSKYFSK